MRYFIKKLFVLSILLLFIIAAIVLYEKFINYEQVDKYDDPNAFRVSFINQWPGFTLEQLPIIKELLEERYARVIIDHNNYDLIIDGVFGDRKIARQNSVKLFFTGEAIKPKVDQYDLSIGFDYIDDPRYIRIPLYYMYFSNKINTNLRRGKCTVNKPYFACFLYSNSGLTNNNVSTSFDGCLARNSLFHKLSKYKKVNSGGSYLNNEGKNSPQKGDNKKTIEWFSKCKFVISYENRTYPGYVTEKVFFAHIAGAVPIYYGHESYNRDVNPKSVIYAGDFSNENELVEYIKKVDNDDDVYCKIWNNSMITNKESNYQEIKNKLREKLFRILDQKINK